MRCINCDCEIENDDNFCPMCGNITPRGYMNYQKNKLIIPKNDIGNIFTLAAILIIIFVSSNFILGKNIYKPYIYLKKQFLSYKYGYQISLMDTNNVYDNELIDSANMANQKIISDFEEQSWMCKDSGELVKVENRLIHNYQIISVNLCDVDVETALEIEKVFNKMDVLFPNTKGYLTNLTITNAKNKKDYIAYFQPINVFVNDNSDINIYNRVNKTQILLNSYYYLNTNKIKIRQDWYPKDATIYSVIANELGHYITFSLLLKEYNAGNITYITKDNISTYEEILANVNSKEYSKDIIMNALNNYNHKNNENLAILEYTKQISNYASQLDSDGNLIYDEIIAEAIHDYYLHENNSSPASIEIINIIKEKMGMNL